jgi:hypothetical protein
MVSLIDPHRIATVSKVFYDLELMRYASWKVLHGLSLTNIGA